MNSAGPAGDPNAGQSQGSDPSSFAAGDTSAFAGSRRLQANPAIVRQRIGIRHRLLFSVKGESLEIIDLIERKDLEKAIRNFGRKE
jgi:hypothetical protein